MYNLSDPQMSISNYLYDTIIDKDNTLIKIRDIFPWQVVAEEFAEKFYSSKAGRNSKQIVVMIGLYILKPWTNLSDEKLIAQAKTDLLLKAFLGLEPDNLKDLPKDASLMTKFRNKIGLEGQKIIDDQIRETLKKTGVIKGKKIQSDTTAITFTIPHPTDTGLVTSMIKALGSAIQKANPTGYTKRYIKTLINKGQKIYKKWILFGRKEKDEAIKCLSELYTIGQEVLKKAKRAKRKVSKDLRIIIGKTKEKGALAKNKTYQKKKMQLQELDQHIELSTLVLQQTKDKIDGKQNIPNRIINYFLPTLRAIKRGKVGKMCEFGLKIFLNYEKGFITSIDKVKGNLNENKCVEKSLQKHKKDFGHLPRSYGYDRGLDDEKLMNKYEKKGVAMITQSKTGRKKNKHEHTKRGKKSLRERSGVEAKIGEGKRCHGWSKVKYRSEETAMMGILSGATAMNLKRLIKMI